MANTNRLARVRVLGLIPAFCFLFAAPLHAAEASAPASLTLQGLIDFALTKGKDRVIDPRTASDLGFPKGDLAVKRIGFGKASDQRMHTFNVAYVSSDEKPLKPTDLIWAIAKSAVTANGKFIEAEGFRVSPDGKLLAAMRVSGKVGKLKQHPLDTSSPEVKTDFEKEKDFWLSGKH